MQQDDEPHLRLWQPPGDVSKQSVPPKEDSRNDPPPTIADDRMKKRQVSSAEFRDYWYGDADARTTAFVEEQLKDPDSDASYLRWLKQWDASEPPPRIAAIIAERKAMEAEPDLDGRKRPFRVIGPTNPDLPGVNTRGGGRSPD